jgi:prepilin-type N-terminal cleavage/methylation domain-containing protein
MRRSSHSFRGFTLLEVLVALTVGGMVLVAAAGVFGAVADGGRELRAARTALDRARNARRWLAATFLSLEIGQDAASPFEGRPDRVSFTAWEEEPGGWLARRRIRLGLSGQGLTATIGDGDALVLADSVSALGFDYLLEPGLNASWVREWISPVSAPVAVRIRIRRVPAAGRRAPSDTLLFLIKERG